MQISNLPKWVLRHRQLIDPAVVVLFVVMHVLVLSVEPHPPGVVWWSMLLVSCPAFALLLLRRRWPWVPLVGCLAAAVTLTFAWVPEDPLNFAILVGVYSVLQRSGIPGAALATVLAMLWPVIYSWGDPPLAAVVSTLIASVDLFMVVGLAYAVRLSRRRAAQLESTVTLLDEAREQLAAEAVAGERARIAREFHDIVSHNLSVVALRAGVARALVDRDPGHAEETLRELEHTSRAALGELRGLLGRLREQPTEQGLGVDDEDHSDREPSPGLHKVDNLVESVRGTGVVWRLDRRGEVRELGPGVEMAAYRIVQEAVTNVLKHARSGYARVVLDYGSSTLRLEVTNHATGPNPVFGRLPVVSSLRGGSGQGLIGLRERAALLGGTFTAHPVPNGFHLAAVLPCPENSDLV